MHDTLFFFAGEPSGDLHGSHLLKALKQKFPHTSFIGVGGPDMRKEGLKSLLTMEDFAVMGFSDVIKAFPKLYRQFHLIKNAILDQKPQGVVLIDYPAFNLRLAKHLRKNGYRGKIIQYISPSVWAWGKNRIEILAENYDLLLSILPFEKEYFENQPLKVQYVGHPLAEYISHYHYQTDWRGNLGIPPQKKLISLFPGSRRGEIERNLPKLLQALKMLKKADQDYFFMLSLADDNLKSMIFKILDESDLKLSEDLILVPKMYHYEMMKDSLAAIAKSGTVTLELALHECPTAVVYELSCLNRFLAKYIFRINLPFYCIVNILRKKAVFPEMIASGFTPENLFSHIQKLVKHGQERKNCLEECKEISLSLQEKNTSEQAASAIQELLKC